MDKVEFEWFLDNFYANGKEEKTNVFQNFMFIVSDFSRRIKEKKESERKWRQIAQKSMKGRVRWN